MARHRRGSQDGITIVEILVSLLMLGVVLTAFLRVMVGGLQSLTDSGQRQDTSQMSTASLEVLRAVQPAEVAMFVDPLLTDPAEIDIAAVSDCTAQVDDDGDGTVDRTPPGYDPDGTGPLDCEEIRTSTLGAVRSELPFFGSRDGVQVQTFATNAAAPGVPDGVARVVIVLTYELPDGTETVRRQSLFSEVSRG